MAYPGRGRGTHGRIPAPQKTLVGAAMNGQFEQAINAVFLEKPNCGINLQHIDPVRIGDFLYRWQDFEKPCPTSPVLAMRRFFRKWIRFWPIMPGRPYGCINNSGS